MLGEITIHAMRRVPTPFLSYSIINLWLDDTFHRLYWMMTYHISLKSELGTYYRVSFNNFNQESIYIRLATSIAARSLENYKSKKQIFKCQKSKLKIKIIFSKQLVSLLRVYI